MISAFVDRHRVDDAQLRRGLETGTFAIDTRLRDALRSLRQPDGGFRIPVGGGGLSFVAPTVEESAAFAAEVSVLVSADAIVRAEERIAALEARLRT